MHRTWKYLCTISQYCRLELSWAVLGDLFVKSNGHPCLLLVGPFFEPWLLVPGKRVCFNIVNTLCVLPLNNSLLWKHENSWWLYFVIFVRSPPRRIYFLDEKENIKHLDSYGNCKPTHPWNSVSRINKENI